MPLGVLVNRPTPMDSWGGKGGYLPLILPYYCFCSWLLSLQVSPLGHKIL
jgi:hypothetical protein